MGSELVVEQVQTIGRSDWGTLEEFLGFIQKGGLTTMSTS